MQSPLLFLGDIGGSELILIMVVILVFFGANKIPELARGLGKGIREFKDASREIRNEFENAGQPAPQQPYAPPAPPVYSAPVAGLGTGAATSVTSAPTEPVPHLHDTPLAPAVPAAEGVPGTQPRRPLDQTSTDV